MLLRVWAPRRSHCVMRETYGRDTPAEAGWERGGDSQGVDGDLLLSRSVDWVEVDVLAMDIGLAV